MLQVFGKGEARVDEFHGESSCFDAWPDYFSVVATLPRYGSEASLDLMKKALWKKNICVFLWIFLSSRKKQQQQQTSSDFNRPPPLVPEMSQWWEHSLSTNVARVRFPDSASYVGWVFWFSTLHREIFLRVLRFPRSAKTNIWLALFVNFS